MIKLLLFLLVLLLLGYASLRFRGRQHWQRERQWLMQRLHGSSAALIEPGSPALVDLTPLPAPVARWFARVLPEGVPKARFLQLTHRGLFNTRSNGERWAPFVSTQTVRLDRPGFLWDARIRMFPGLAVHVHDAYLDGEGILRAQLLGQFPLADLADREGLAEGELMRWIAEAAWYPWVLLPGPAVCWRAVDEHHADVTVSDGPLTLTLRFGFDAGGLLRSVQSESRGRSVSGQIVPTPWEGLWSDYRKVDGRLVPMAGEVAWRLPEGRKPYWRGTVTEMRLEP
ncbi:MAG: hypothetical protein MUE46_03020 [Xanthomonadales bacterium]|jgi:hypothetical protein|nr:hypothetical protein [Xanthomonadales bacterium]